MIGLVLCGGQSSRMGKDKGLLLHEQQTWVQQAYTLLRELNIPVFISVNTLQQEVYASQFPSLQLITDNSAVPVKGPLLGLLSAHAQYPDEDIFLLACDMLLMKKNILQKLQTVSVEYTEKDAFVFQNEEQKEPLCAIYTAAALKKISNTALIHQLPRFSIHYILEQMNVQYVQVEENEKKSFENFNTPDSLESL
jgi:molybdopterin-guanine dinucleotide biosynthesis protein A